MRAAWCLTIWTGSVRLLHACVFVCGQTYLFACSLEFNACLSAAELALILDLVTLLLDQWVLAVPVPLVTAQSLPLLCRLPPSQRAAVLTTETWHAVTQLFHCRAVSIDGLPSHTLTAFEPVPPDQVAYRMFVPLELTSLTTGSPSLRCRPSTRPSSST